MVSIYQEKLRWNFIDLDTSFFSWRFIHAILSFLVCLGKADKKIWLFSLIFCLSAIAVSCSQPNVNPGKTPASTPSLTNQPFRVALIPGSASESPEKLKPLGDYLQKVTNQQVVFNTPKTYEAAVDLMVNEQVDMAFLGPLSYIQAKERNPDLAPILMPIEQATGRPWYTSLIVGNPDKGIESLQDLKGKRFAFTSPSSTSGFLIPLAALQAQNIDPTRDFSSIVYGGSHDKNAVLLAEDKVDAIALNKGALEVAKTEGRVPSNIIKTLWESDPIPTSPFVINAKKFSPESLAKLQQALVDAPPGLLSSTGIKYNGYTIAKDSDFEQIRQIYTKYKSVVIPPK